MYSYVHIRTEGHKNCADTAFSDTCRGPVAHTSSSRTTHAAQFRSAQKRCATCPNALRSALAGDDTCGSNALQRCKCFALLQRCKAAAPSHATHTSFASPLRLSGEPPDSRRGGAVTSNRSRRDSCEGARESRGSHSAGCNGRL